MAFLNIYIQIIKPFNQGFMILESNQQIRKHKPTNTHISYFNPQKYAKIFVG